MTRLTHRAQGIVIKLLHACPSHVLLDSLLSHLNQSANQSIDHVHLSDAQTIGICSTGGSRYGELLATYLYQGPRPGSTSLLIGRNMGDSRVRIVGGWGVQPQLFVDPQLNFLFAPWGFGSNHVN